MEVSSDLLPTTLGSQPQLPKMKGDYLTTMSLDLATMRDKFFFGNNSIANSHKTLAHGCQHTHNKLRT